MKDKPESPQDEANPGDGRDDADAGAEESERRRGPRARLDALIPDAIRRAILQGAEALVDDKLGDGLVGDVVRRAIHVGNEVVDSTEDQVRKILQEMPVAREVGDRVAGRLDEYKGEVFRIVKNEVHEFLERVDIGAELQKLLTSVSFEIVTEVRFIPNEKAAQGGPAIKPEVKSGVRVKRADEPRRPRRSSRGAKAEPEA